MPTFIKRLCGVFLGLLLLLPALQARLRWVKEMPLDGAYVVAPKAEFSAAGLLNNSYQVALEKYVDDRIGFRSLIIRLRNQLGYSVFDEAWAARMAVGHGKVLFGLDYIDSYLGKDFVGEAVVRHNARRLRSVQDSLARHGVRLVFVIAPSKATFMPEHLPRFGRRPPAARNNYLAYAEALEAAGVHTVDFSRALRQWRRTAPYPLFSSGGVHWSMYGGARAADSLQRYLRQRLNVAPAPFRLADIETSATPRDTDDDMSKTLNMLLTPPAETLAYPRLVFATLPAALSKPNLLLIGDSFGWTWIHNGFIANAFSEKSHYWFYNYQVAWAGTELPPEGREIWRLKLREHYLSRDVIVLLFNEMNLRGFDSGFTQEVFNIFNPYTPAEQTRYDNLLAELRQQVSWEKAQVGGDSLELRLRKQATATLDHLR